MSRSIRAVVVDDERFARQLIHEYLEGVDDVEVVADCANGFEAVRAVHELEPDLLFLDIQMPKLDGFEVLELLEHEPLVVFTTAHDEYALEAFDAAAVDYLLKPFSEERFLETLERVRTRRPETASETIDRVKDASRNRPVSRLVVRDGPAIEIIPVGRIHYLEARGDYVKIVHANGEETKKSTLSELADALDPELFVRTHRSYVVRLDRIERIEPYAKNSYVAILRDDSRIPVSRSRYPELRDRL